MDEIRELLQNLNQLSAEDLDKLRGLILAKFDELDAEETTPENVAALNELADAGEQVQGEGNQRAEAQAKAEQERDAARERIAAIKGEDAEDPEAETPETPEAETEETPEAEAETPAEETPAEPVVASAKPVGKVARMAARQTKPKASPEAVEPENTHTALVASGELRGVPSGTELSGDTLAEAMARTLQRMPAPQGKPGAQGRDMVVASANWTGQYPEERRFQENDWLPTSKSVNEAALTATGGICSPVNVDWTINTIATPERPLQAALPANQVSRGGLIYRPDLDFAGLSAATGIWTEATDLAPAGATKPIVQIACPGTTTTYVEAISTRLGFGNMQSRFDPENVAANTDAALAAYARVAENNLLNLIATAATQGVTNTHALGATRDLLSLVGQAIAAYRNLHRIPRSQAVRAIFPDWMKELLRIDLARETAHQQDSSWNSLAISDAQIESLFEPYGVSPIWHLDGQAAANGVAVSQLFTTQSTGAVNVFPTSVTWYLYYEGALQYLDGGRLDLGIVRDSLLDATNDYETFVEVFETVVYRGFSGGLIQFNTTLCASGGSAGTQNTQASTSTTCP